MALAIPAGTLPRDLAAPLHAIKRTYNFDRNAVELLVHYKVVNHSAAAQQIQTVVEITANGLIELVFAAANMPIADVRCRIQFTANSATTSVISSDNWATRGIRGVQKKLARQKFEALLRPVIEEALRPHSLPNKLAYVKKLEKAIALEYLNLISDLRIDFSNGSQFRIDRI